MDAPVRGFAIRFWAQDPINPHRGRALWTGGPASTFADGVGKVRKIIEDYPGEKDPRQTCGYLTSEEPSRRLLEEFALLDAQGVIAHPLVVAFCPMNDALPGD